MYVAVQFVLILTNEVLSYTCFSYVEATQWALRKSAFFLEPSSEAMWVEAMPACKLMPFFPLLQRVHADGTGLRDLRVTAALNGTCH